MGDGAYSKRLRVAGNVQPGSIKRSRNHVEFVLMENDQLLHVVYSGTEAAAGYLQGQLAGAGGRQFRTRWRVSRQAAAGQVRVEVCAAAAGSTGQRRRPDRTHQHANPVSTRPGRPSGQASDACQAKASFRTFRKHRGASLRRADGHLPLRGPVASTSPQPSAIFHLGCFAVDLLLSSPSPPGQAVRPLCRPARRERRVCAGAALRNSRRQRSREDHAAAHAGRAVAAYAGQHLDFGTTDLRGGLPRDRLHGASFAAL